MPEGLRGYFPDVDAEPTAEFTDELLARLQAEFDVGRAPARSSPVSKKVVVTLTPIDERVDVADVEPEPHRRRRWWVPAVAAAAVAAVIAVGVVASRVGDERTVDVIDGPRGLPPTAELLEGIWFEDRGTGHWPKPIMASFDTDGTFALGGVLDEDSWHSGTYETDGHRIVMAVTGGACGSHDVWTWDAGIVADGRLEAVNAGTDRASPDQVGNCNIPVGEPFNFTRVSPTSPGASDIGPGELPVGGGIISNETTSFIELDGYWLQAESGRLLRFDSDGSYRIDDIGNLAANPAGAGRVEIGDQTLTFTTTADADSCAEGDVMVWTNARLDIVENETTLRATVTEDTCGRLLGAEVAFIRLDVDTP